MVDERPEETGSSPEFTGPKRPPPTIDIEPADVSAEPAEATAEAPTAEAPEEPAPEPAAATAPPSPQPPPKPVSPWVIAPISGAVAAALVIGVGWLLGWPEIQPATPAAPQPAAAAIDALTVRVAGLESKAGKPAAPVTDPAAAAKIDALEKSLSLLRGDLSAWRAQSEKLASAVSDGKAAPPPPDLSAVNDRIAKVESAVQAQGAEVALQVSKLAEVKAAETAPADDTLLRRVVAASLLDVAVRHGDPYVAPLAAAKSSADDDAAALKPLEAFAATGVPNPGALCRELVDIVPKLVPPKPEAATTGSGIVDRLQAGAAKLVRIQRSDADGAEPGSVVSRVMAAALRNDVAAAQRELKTLPPADRAAAQAWLDKADARDAALAASRKFADGAMAALAKAGQ